MKTAHIITGRLLSLTLGLLLGGSVAAWAASDPPAAGHADQSAATATNPAQVGQPAPDFSLNDSSGQAHKLSDFRGKNVVLIWTNPTCPSVQRHEREGTFNELSKQFTADKVVFLQINSATQSPSDATSSASPAPGGGHAAVNMWTLNDTDHHVAEQYGARRTPEAFVIDTQGKVQYHGAIDNDPRGNLSAAERDNYVRDALNALASNSTPKVQSTEPYGCPIQHEGIMPAQHGGSTPGHMSELPRGLPSPSGSPYY